MTLWTASVTVGIVVGMISRDPSEKPAMDSEAFERATSMGLNPISVICDEPGSKVGDVGGVSFVSFGHFIPRAGDRIELEDGTVCEVVRVHYRLSRTGGDSMTTLVPNVYAVRVSNETR